MTDKKYAEVSIAGRTYTLGGYEDEEYLQRIATYINAKLGALRETRGFLRHPADVQNMMLQLNMADDYFQQKKKAELWEGRVEELEQQIYDLKHELIAQRMKSEKEQNGTNAG